MNSLLPFLAQTTTPAPAASLLTGERIASGAIGVLVGLVIREIWVLVKDRRASRGRLRTLTTVAHDEITFYLAKLQQLEEELGAFVKTITGLGGTQVFTPSYTVYPDFLEHQRRLIAEHRLSSSEIVRDLGHCAFELRHIAKRMADARTAGAPTLAVSDWSGTHGLVSKNVKVFQAMQEKLKQAL